MRDHTPAEPKGRPTSPWWGAIKSALITEDPVEAARRARSAGSAAPTAPAAESAASSTAADAQAPASALTPMAQTLLAQVLNRATAYTALTDKLAPLEPIVPDERTRYQAAYALIKGSRTLEQVVQAIDLQHLAALDAEVARFTAQLKDTEQREIEHRGDEVKTLNTRIDALHEQIRVAEEALQAERDRVADVTRQIDAKRQEIAAVQAQFDTATQQVKTLLEQAKAKVLRHLT